MSLYQINFFNIDIDKNTRMKSDENSLRINLLKKGQKLKQFTEMIKKIF